VVRKTLAETGEQVDMTPEKVYERDTAGLCGSKHTISVGTTFNPDGLVPFDDYMVVYFRPQDTEGGGQIMNALTDAVIYLMEESKGLPAKLLPGIDVEDYRETTLTGRDIMEQKRDDGDAGDLEYYTYVALDNTVGKLFRWAETDESYRAESPFYAPKGMKSPIETKKFAVGEAGNESTQCNDKWLEYTGGCYHSLSGGTHKVRITITNTFEGKTTTPYKFDLAGCNADYLDESYCASGEATKRFLINKPGNWTISVKPIATGTCGSLDYNNVWSFDVDKPEGWTPPVIEALTDGISKALQEVGIPIDVTPLKFVAGCSVIGGIILTKIWKNKRAKREKEE